MGLLADDVRVDRRSGLRALAIVLLLLCVVFVGAWLTLGRAARFQSMKGAFLSFDLPPSFTQIHEEGSGASLTSLARSPRLERTYASTLAAEEACAALRRSFDEGNVDVLPLPAERGVACSFAGPVGRYSLTADLRAAERFLHYVDAGDLDVPVLPEGTRSVTVILVKG